MKLENQELMNEYALKVQEQYPELSITQIKEICAAPFQQAKDGIESGEFPTIRMKFFGTFLVYPKKAASMLRFYEDQLSKEKIKPEYFQNKVQELYKFLAKMNYEIPDNTK